MENQLGQSTLTTKRIGGQLIRITDTWLGFILEHGLYRKAGDNQSNGGHWPQKYREGSLDREGISINKRLYRKVMKNPELEFYVYNNQRDEFYRLCRRELLTGDYVGKETQKSRELVVTPFDAYETVEAWTVPDKMQKLKAQV